MLAPKQEVIFITGRKNTKKGKHAISVNKIIEKQGSELCSVLPAVHSFTGQDCISSFVRIGKVKPLKLLKKDPAHVDTFEELGKTVDVSEAAVSKLEKFTCDLYKYGHTTGINKLREKMYKAKAKPKVSVLSQDEGVDLSLLPPCRRSLLMHIKRANYQCLSWMNAGTAQLRLPSPVGHGWRMEGHELDFHWFDGDMLPQTLVDVIVDKDSVISDTSADELDDTYIAESIVDHIFENSDDEDI